MAESDTRDATTYTIGPLQRKTFIAGLRPAQVISLGAALVGGLILFKSLPGLPAVLAAVVFAGLAFVAGFMKFGGRHLEEWIMPLFGRFTRARGPRRTFVSPTPFVGETQEQRAKAVPPPTMVGVHIMRVKTDRQKEIGVIKDDKAGTYTAVIEVRSDAFALLDRSEQERRLANWGQVLASSAREGSPIHRLQWIERAIPEDGDAIEGYLRQHVALPADHPLLASYRELIDSAGPVTQQHEIYLAVQVSAAKAARQMRKLADNDDEGACELLLRELNNLENVLHHADLQVVGVLSPRRVGHVLRTAFDPAAVRKLAARAGGDADLVGTAPRNAWPMATETDWGWYRTDGSFHATFWVAEFPRISVMADFFAPLLLQTKFDRVVSVIMSPIPPSKALREIETKHTSYLADQEIRDKAGYLNTARRKQEYDALTRTETELATGHASFRFSCYVTVTAETEEELDRRCAEIEQAGHMARLDLRRCWGEQDTGFCCTLPLGRGLR